MQTLPAVWAGGVRTHLAGGAVRPPPRPADPAGLSCGPRPGPLGHTAQHPAGRPRPRPQVCFEGLAAAVPWRGAWPGGLGSGSPPPGGPVSPAKGGMCVCGEAAGAEDAAGGCPEAAWGRTRARVSCQRAPCWWPQGDGFERGSPPSPPAAPGGSAALAPERKLRLRQLSSWPRSTEARRALEPGAAILTESCPSSVPVLR